MPRMPCTLGRMSTPYGCSRSRTGDRASVLGVLRGEEVQAVTIAAYIFVGAVVVLGLLALAAALNGRNLR